MVLQFYNFFIQKFDLNNNTNESNCVTQTDPDCDEKLNSCANFSNFDQTIEELFTKSNVVLYDCDHLLSSDPNNNVEQNGSDDIQLIERLRKINNKIIFISNRSDRTRQQMLIQLNILGINASIDEMFPTSYTTAVYLKAIGFERQVFVVGSDAIEQELNNVGIESTGLCCYSSPKDMNPGFLTFNLNPKVGAVVVSFDRQIPLPHLFKACSYATKPDCLFIVTNYGDHISANSEPSAQVAAIQVVSNKGFISLAKSHRLYFHCIRQIHPDFDLNKSVIITKRLSADIAFAKNIGIKTVLIDSNICENAYSRRTQMDFLHYKPDYLLDSLSSLTQLLYK